MKRQLIFKLISFTLGTALALLLAEVVYRAYHYVVYVDLTSIDIGNKPHFIVPDEEVPLGQMIQRSGVKDIVYELIPNSTYKYKGVPVATNSNGFRCPDFTKKKQGNTRRIVGLGDSVMFGWGVNEEECYLSQLESELNHQDSVHYEVINTGVPGYNTVMEVATLAQKFDLSEVDMVIINFVGNDFELPDFIRTKPNNYLTLQESFIINRFKRSDEIQMKLEGNLFGKSEADFKDGLDKLPPEYRRLLGLSNYIRAMEELKEMSVKYGFEVLVLETQISYELPEFLPATCERLGFELLQMKKVWEKYKTEHPDAQWELSAADAHPTPLGHRIIAEELLKRLLKNEPTASLTTH